MSGYFLPLSGGIDSCATACIIHSMCRLVVKTAQQGGKLCFMAETPICLLNSSSQIDKSSKTPEESRRKKKDRLTFRRTRRNSPAGSSIHATWERRTPALLPESEQRTWRKPSEGKILASRRSDKTSDLPFYCSYHVDLNMDVLVTAVRELFSMVLGFKPKYKVHGGSMAENLALQNIQVCIC
jgi:NAD+ synthase (glutamine-hydrolysing)